MKILVTGGTGFLGSYLLRYLVQKGEKNIIALKRASSSMQVVADIEDQVQWVEGDILDVPLLGDMMEEVDQVYHCAAIVSYAPSRRKQLLKTNVEGTANIVNLGLDVGIKKLVHVSSTAAIGLPKRGGTLTEKSKWIRSNYNSDYSISKYLSEQEVWRGMAEGLNIAIVNPSVMVGSGIWSSGTCALYERVWNGQKMYPIGSTGFVDVRDVARMLIQLMESELHSERFLANGENLSYLSFFTAVAQALQKNAPTIKASSLLSSLAWRTETLRTSIFGGEPIITKSRAYKTARQYFYDNQKSIAQLNFDYTPIEETIRETGRQFLEGKQDGKGFSVLPLS